MTRIAGSFIAALGLIVLVFALSPTGGRAAAPPPSKTYTVVIDKMRFAPPPQGLHPGDVILWVNNDFFRHTATAKDGSFAIDLAPRTRGKMIVKRAGTIAFYCKYHPGMKGVLVVSR